MRWVKFIEEKPPVSGFYYWKGKKSYSGGFSHYWTDTDTYQWDWPDDVAVNHVDESYLQWLDEKN